MHKRVLTGVILAALLVFTISLAAAWPLRIGLMLCFVAAVAELWAAGRLRSMRGLRYTLIEMFVLVAAALAIVLLPISATEMFAVIIAAFMADIGGYFVGRSIGRTKLRFLERLSPKKTMEGYLGGLLMSWVATAVFVLTVGRTMPEAPKLLLMLFGGAVGFAGDLLGSAAKRELGIKDSDDAARNLPIMQHAEKLMAGHGGYLDRFDSLGLVVVFYYLVTFFF